METETATELFAAGGVPDVGDPIVVFVSIALGELLKRTLPAQALAFIKPVLPAIIVLLAVFARVVYDMLATGEGITVETAFRALAAGGVAIMTHTQFRSLVKAVKARDNADGSEATPDSGSGS